MSRTAQEASRIAPEVMARYEAVIGSRSARAASDRDQGFLRLLDALWRRAQFEHVSRVPGIARRAARAQSESARLGSARLAGDAVARFRNVRASPAKIISIRTCPRATKFPCTSCRWRSTDASKSKQTAKTSASASRACTWRTTPAKACTKVSPTPTAGAMSISIAAAFR